MKSMVSVVRLDPAMLLRVFDEPEIVLFVRVCVSVVPTTVPYGAVFVAQVSRSASHAWTLVPMTRPRFVLASAAVAAPVPP